MSERACPGILGLGPGEICAESGVNAYWGEGLAAIASKRRKQTNQSKENQFH